MLLKSTYNDHFASPFLFVRGLSTSISCAPDSSSVDSTCIKSTLGHLHALNFRTKQHELWLVDEDNLPLLHAAEARPELLSAAAAAAVDEGVAAAAPADEGAAAAAAAAGPDEGAAADEGVADNGALARVLLLVNYLLAQRNLLLLGQKVFPSPRN